jgi:hypothetical protein
MGKRVSVLAVALLCLLVPASPLVAWNNQGHMTVAYIAYTKLRPEVRDRAYALLKFNPYYSIWLKAIPAGTSEADKQEMILMLSATWPDEIKRDHRYRTDGTDHGDRPDGATSSQNVGYSDLLLHKYWHFVDTPFTQDGTALSGPPTPNAETQIVVFRRVLSSSEPDALKSYDLVWLVHLVGDVHQPLHCASRFSKDLPDGDAGANLVKLNPQPSKNELHAFWDDILGTSDKPTSAINLGKRIAAADASLASDTNVDHWISESFEDAEADVYVGPIGAGAGPFTITAAYKKAARALAEKRVALAGARLANVLNSELK